MYVFFGCFDTDIFEISPNKVHLLGFFGGTGFGGSLLGTQPTEDDTVKKKAEQNRASGLLLGARAFLNDRGWGRPAVRRLLSEGKGSWLIPLPDPCIIGSANRTPPSLAQSPFCDR